MNLQKLALYEPEIMQGVANEASASFASQSAWVSSFIEGVAKLVWENPIAYRAFGPYWWPLKKLMVEGKYFAGDDPDEELVAKATFGNASLDCAAAFAYSEYSHGALKNESNTLQADTEDGDTIDYRLWDDEMEGRIAEK